jgi:Domain of unknown function (DUF4386)
LRKQHWSQAVFGAHLCLLGYLAYRSAYVPPTIGIVLVAAGFGWIVGVLGPYFAPVAHLDAIGITVVGELIFMLWLLIKGRKIPQSAIA